MADNTVNVYIVGHNRLSGAVAGAESSLTRLSTRMASVGQTMTRFVTLPVLAAGGASIYFAAQFESSMSKMVGLSGQSARSVENMRDKVLDLAGRTARAPAELADALYFITSSGQSGATALETLRISARAAAAGLGETKVVADALTSIMAAYGVENISAARAADIMTASIKFGKAEADDLANGIGNLAPLASQLGVSFEDVGASIAAMTMVGVDTETAFVNMSAIFSGLLKTTPAAAAKLEEVGLSAQGLRDTISQPGGVLVALRQVDEAFGGNEEAMARVFPNIRALRGIMALLAQNGAEVDKIFQGVTDSTGDLDHAFDAASKTADFKFKQGLAKLQVAAIDLGNDLLPIATKIVGVVSDMAKAFTSLPDWAQTFIVGGAAVAAATGPLLRFSSSLINLATSMPGVVSGIGGLIAKLGPLAAAGGPFALGALAVGGITLALSELNTSSAEAATTAENVAGKSFRALTNELRDLKSQADQFVDSSLPFMDKGNRANTFYGELKNNFRDLAANSVDLANKFLQSGEAAKLPRNVLNDLKRILNETAAAQDRFKDSSRELIDSQLGLEGAQLRVDSAMEQYNRVLADGTATDLQRREAQFGVKTAIDQLAQAALTSTGSQEGQIASLQLLAGTLQPGSPLRTYVDQYIFQLQAGVPDEVNTTLRVSGVDAALAEIARFANGAAAALGAAGAIPGPGGAILPIIVQPRGI